MDTNHNSVAIFASRRVRSQAKDKDDSEGGRAKSLLSQLSAQQQTSCDGLSTWLNDPEQTWGLAPAATITWAHW